MSNKKRGKSLSEIGYFFLEKEELSTIENTLTSRLKEINDTMVYRHPGDLGIGQPNLLAIKELEPEKKLITDVLFSLIKQKG